MADSPIRQGRRLPLAWAQRKSRKRTRFLHDLLDPARYLLQLTSLILFVLAALAMMTGQQSVCLGLTGMAVCLIMVAVTRSTKGRRGGGSKRSK